ncbi:TrbL/VirB6 family protein [Phenylobacterium koreense]|uniref:Type IV secretion system protein VirB6 n=1 Tax=Phenylobacterium koreense TaxID=266125 RepID=A0ABV2EKZ7_9CAUL
MSAACAAMVDDGVIRGVLATVECQTRAYAEGGFQALTSGSSVFQYALTAILTIYVALIGYRMLFARGAAQLSDAPGIALKIGLILALVTSWSTFQTLVFDVADRAPEEIAAIVSAPMAEASDLAASPIDGLQAAYDEFSATASAYGKVAGPQAKGYSSPQAAAAESAAGASGLLFLSSAGVISAATLAIGVLTAVGPIFIVLALFPVTRGLFVGWVRAMVAATATPLVAWLLIVLMLSVIEPWIGTLNAQRLGQRLAPQTAMSASALIFVFAGGQAGLVLGAWIMALSFKLPTLDRDRDRRGLGARANAAGQAVNVNAMPSRAERLALNLQRDQAQATERSRAAAMAASTRPAPGRSVNVTLDETRRLGDSYRRNAFYSRRAGAAR